MRTKKELKGLFTSFKGLNKLKRIIENKSCADVNCSNCPLGKDKLKDNIDCLDIIELSLYEEKDPEAVETMNQLLDIFIEEKINKNLSLIDNRLKCNSKVTYNGKSYTIKGVLKKKFIDNSEKPILLNGFCCNDYDPVYDICVIKEADMKKKYTLWVDIQDFEWI